MGLVCFDDVEHLAVLSPFLTVIDQPAETFGSLGAQLLLERISGKAGQRSRRIVLQTDLIVRESCCIQVRRAGATDVIGDRPPLGFREMK